MPKRDFVPFLPSRFMVNCSYLTNSQERKKKNDDIKEIVNNCSFDAYQTPVKKNRHNGSIILPVLQQNSFVRPISKQETHFE